MAAGCGRRGGARVFIGVGERTPRHTGPQGGGGAFSAGRSPGRTRRDLGDDRWGRGVCDRGRESGPRWAAGRCARAVDRQVLSAARGR